MYPMGKMIKRSFFYSVCALFCVLFISGAGFAAQDDYVAALYTHEDYQGVEWKISEAGMYDLFENFNIPNDSICSIKVRPGYSLTLFEHAGFKGKSQTWSEDAPSLDGFWRRQASSLEVQDRGDEWKASFGRRIPWGRVSRSATSMRKKQRSLNILRKCTNPTGTAIPRTTNGL